MRLVKRMLLWVLVWASHAGAQSSSVERYSGVARSPSGEFLYREQHEVIERDGRPLRALTVYYDRKTRRLIEYQGVSNLETPDGDTQDVVIQYAYPGAA